MALALPSYHLHFCCNTHEDSVENILLSHGKRKTRKGKEKSHQIMTKYKQKDLTIRTDTPETRNDPCPHLMWICLRN